MEYRRCHLMSLHKSYISSSSSSYMRKVPIFWDKGRTIPHVLLQCCYRNSSPFSKGFREFNFLGRKNICTILWEYRIFLIEEEQLFVGLVFLTWWPHPMVFRASPSSALMNHSWVFGEVGDMAGWDAGIESRSATCKANSLLMVLSSVLFLGMIIPGKSSLLSKEHGKSL